MIIASKDKQLKEKKRENDTLLARISQLEEEIRKLKEIKSKSILNQDLIEKASIYSSDNEDAYWMKKMSKPSTHLA